MARTVKVRIAVVVDAAGEYSASGWGGSRQPDSSPMAEAHDNFYEPVGAVLEYWVTAELPVPEAVEVEGAVEWLDQKIAKLRAERDAARRDEDAA